LIREDEASFAQPHAQLWSEDGLDHLPEVYHKIFVAAKNISGLFQSEMGLFQTALSSALPETLKLKLNESGSTRREAAVRLFSATRRTRSRRYTHSILTRSIVE
jgi:hypothetical protein